MNLWLHICVVIFCGLIGSSHAVMAVAKASEETFDYFMLSHEWPFSFCLTNQCTNTNKLLPLFNIHGLWPEKVSGKCQGQFNVSELLPIKAELETAWMDLKNPNNEPTKFWSHEYNKHGECASVDSRYASTFLYFNAALQLHKNYTLTVMLDQGGIKPGPNPIKASRIQDALAKSFGHQPELSCVKNQDITYLIELRLCFEKDLTPRNCSSQQSSPDSHSAQAGGDLKYIPIEMSPEERLTDGGTLEGPRPPLRAELCQMDANVLLPASLGP